MSTILRASWYRFRATFRQEWGSYLTIVLLLGLLGGLAMGSVAAARRTQSSFAALVETTNPSQVEVSTAIASPGIGNGQGYDPVSYTHLDVYKRQPLPPIPLSSLPGRPPRRGSCRRARLTMSWPGLPWNAT